MIRNKVILTSKLKFTVISKRKMELQDVRLSLSSSIEVHGKKANHPSKKTSPKEKKSKRILKIRLVGGFLFIVLLVWGFF